MGDVREQMRRMSDAATLAQAELVGREQRSRRTRQSLQDEMRARTRRLMRPGAVEKLVVQGRTPRLFGDPPFICQIPPEGIQAGDSVRVAYADDIVLEFFAPDGTSRGMETSVHLTLRQAEKIRGRIERAKAANS